MSNDEKRDKWSRFKDLATGISVLTVPVVVALVGNAINVALKDRDVKIKTVELAVSILAEDPQKGPETPVLREWAMSVIDAYSGVPLPDGARTELQSQPIVRTPNMIISCTENSVTLSADRYRSVSITEDDDGCVMSVDGSTRLAAACPTINGRLFADISASAYEHGEHCIFDIGD